ncbi:hypothetical protein [Leeuwenhoekiella sp. H156]|uniref:hypothetical protein n=1 Tax=Leeuwenhoekiella sp. H156 TaxID=3450128 RepID=UPI003FA4057A
MKCIICDKNANATGSHIAPASLIQNCIGKHYWEESYEIDSKNATVDVYFGRNNLKNTNTEIKKHHHKVDEILCQTCENKLGKLESEFSTEFLQKFRIEKFKNNFHSYNLETGFEITEPNKLSNLKIHAYIYSIILRYCRDVEFKNGHLVLMTESELTKIKSFVNGFLNEQETDYTKSITDFNLVIVFDKNSDKGSLVIGLEESDNPYLFYFCEVIIQLFTKQVSEKAKYLFNGCLNSINESKSKIVVGPSEFYQDLMRPAQKVLMNEIITNGTNELCRLNNKSYKENLIEFNHLVAEYENKEIELPIFRAFEDLRKKYSG